MKRAGLHEEAVLFGSGGSLVGIVAAPEEVDPGRPAFIFLNAGLTHRVGPNRLYVNLARALAEDGFVSLRFDFSGLGDSAVRTDELSAIQSLVIETQEAMSHLEKDRGVERFVLVGICSGANSSYLTAQQDDRVLGAVLINAQAHLHGDDPELAEFLHARMLSRHSWRIALRSSFRWKNWKKALQGRLDPKRILSMMLGGPLRALRAGNKTQASPPMPDALAELRRLTGRGVRLFHLYCEGDEGLDYFHAVLGDRVSDVASDDNSRFEVIRGSNHVFTLLWSQQRLIETVRQWCRTALPPGAQ